MRLGTDRHPLAERTVLDLAIQDATADCTSLLHLLETLGLFEETLVRTWTLQELLGPVESAIADALPPIVPEFHYRIHCLETTSLASSACFVSNCAE